jgi:phospholipid/cholesterol/gamma-HCH transport system substrate-binding protein
VQINNDIKLPDDTSASISSDGLLGGNYVGLSPGGSNTMLAPGQSFAVTQSAVNIEDLLGKFIFSMGDTGKSGTSQSAGQPGVNSSSSASSTSSANPAALSGSNGSK